MFNRTSRLAELESLRQSDLVMAYRRVLHLDLFAPLPPNITLAEIVEEILNRESGEMTGPATLVTAGSLPH